GAGAEADGGEGDEGGGPRQGQADPQRRPAGIRDGRQNTRIQLEGQRRHRPFRVRRQQSQRGVGGTFFFLFLFPEGHVDADRLQPTVGEQGGGLGPHVPVERFPV